MSSPHKLNLYFGPHQHDFSCIWHKSFVLTGSWFLSFTSNTVILTSVSKPAGYSEGKVTPVRNRGSLLACQKRHVNCKIHTCVCVFRHTFVQQHTLTERRAKELEDKWRKEVKEPTAGLSLFSPSPPACLPAPPPPPPFPAASPGCKVADRALPSGSTWSCGKMVLSCSERSAEATKRSRDFSGLAGWRWD